MLLCFDAWYISTLYIASRAFSATHSHAAYIAGGIVGGFRAEMAACCSQAWTDTTDWHLTSFITVTTRAALRSAAPVILWPHEQDDDLACGHSVSLVLLPGTVYQQTFELHRHLQTLNSILRHVCLFDPMHPRVRAVGFERRPCSDHVTAPYKLS